MNNRFNKLKTRTCLDLVLSHWSSSINIKAVPTTADSLRFPSPWLVVNNCVFFCCDQMEDLKTNYIMLLVHRQ